MKKAVLFLLFVGLVTATVWLAVNELPRIASRASTDSMPPSGRLTTNPPMPPSAPVCGTHCGTERWPVKTLSDRDRGCVSLNVVDATVEELVALPEPARRPQRSRVKPVECTVYRVEALLGGWDRMMKLENDGDYHLVLFGRTNQRVSIIAEIPDPQCDGACRSGFAERFSVARAAVEAGVNRPNPGDANTVVRVTGVGFFDFKHGQVGLAPNGFELHPVLSIEFLPFGTLAAR